MNEFIPSKVNRCLGFSGLSHPECEGPVFVSHRKRPILFHCLCFGWVLNGCQEFLIDIYIVFSSVIIGGFFILGRLPPTPIIVFILRIFSQQAIHLAIDFVPSAVIFSEVL